MTKKYATAVIRAELCSILHDYIYNAEDEGSYKNRVIATREVFNLETLTKNSVSTESWDYEQRKKK
jgi:hypothetical protein